MSRHTARWAALAVGVVLVAFSVMLALNVRASGGPEIVHADDRGRVPDLSGLTTLDGAPLPRSTWQGKAVVVNFWNDWCIPCRQEVPALRSFYARHKDDADFVMLGVVHEQDDVSAVRAYVAREGIAWTVALDPGSKAALSLGVTGQPETYAIGAATGRVVAQRFSPASVDDLDAMLRAASGP